MSKILDKLGIYDLVAVLLAGISISTFTILVGVSQSLCKPPN